MTDATQSSDPRVPAREDCVMRYVLERRAELQPDRSYIRLPDGHAIGYRAFRDEVMRMAAGLAALGVKQGDHVNVWMPNTVDIVRVWFAINWLGAVYVPINTAYRGNLLAHVIANGDASVMIVGADLVERLVPIDRAALTTLVVAGGGAPAIDGLRRVSLAELDADPATLPPLERPIEPEARGIVRNANGTCPWR